MEEGDSDEIIKLNEIHKEILEYDYFHKNIESYFSENGINENGSGDIQSFYFIDLEWIKQWKKYTNYENVVLNIEKDFNYLKNNNILKINQDSCPSGLNSGESKEKFINQMLYKIEDFECVINQSTYDLFLQNYTGLFGYFTTKIKSIRGVLYDKMLVLLIDKIKRIKILYRGEMEDKIQLIQLSLDIYDNNSYLTTIMNYITGDNYNYFINSYIISNCFKLMDFLLNNNVGFIANNEFIENKIKYHIFNNNLMKKYIINKQRQKMSQISLDKINTPRFIGLKNIGATCYMNATLQCLVNIDQLTRYLLDSNNYSNISDNSEQCELLSCFCCLLGDLCCNDNINGCANPNDFKELISIKNPIFKGIQANDSKDLILFLIEQMNLELNEINQKIININYNQNNNIINNQPMQSNK